MTWSSALKSAARGARDTGARSLKPAARGARDTSARLLEQLWAAGFAVVGKAERPRFDILRARGEQRVVVVAPHPDDETIGCAGVIALHIDAGDKVAVVFVTDGRRSRAMGLDSDAMAKQRYAEAAAAMHALKVTEWEWFGLPEGEWQPETGANKLRQLMARTDPDIIYAPSGVDFHPEHLSVACLLAVCVPAAACVRVYPVQVPLTPTLANCVAPVQEFAGTIQAALAAYSSQRMSVASAMRSRHYAARRYGFPGHAEEFWQMRGAQYTRVHAKGTADSSTSYYGLRYFPFTDPLAYLRGTAARRALADVARRHE